MTPFLCKLEIEGLAPEGALLKLKKEGISLFFAKKTQKNRIEVCVERKFKEKAFTILKNSCYNIKSINNYGVLRLFALCKKRIGLFIGMALFCLSAYLSSYPVLRIDVVGSGAYYKREVLALLTKSGVALGKGYDQALSASLTTEILSMQNVEFCSVKKSGPVLRIEIRTREEGSLCSRGDLTAPFDGVIERLVVLCGNALFKEGDEVKAGDIIASSNGITMAFAKLKCVCRAFAESKEQALAQIMLTIGEGNVLSLTEDEDADGVALTVEYEKTVSVNMD